MSTEERTIKIVELFFSPTASEILHRHEIDSVRTALAALFEYQRMVLELYYGKELSFSEIAQRLELNPVTISGLHNRALSRLTKLLKEMAVLGKRGRPKAIERQISRQPTFQMGATVVIGVRIERRIEIDEIDALVRELAAVVRPLQIVAEVEPIHFTEKHSEMFRLCST